VQFANAISIKAQKIDRVKGFEFILKSQKGFTVSICKSPYKFQSELKSQCQVNHIGSSWLRKYGRIIAG
jgi:hypothetical protein